jgi:hypothetical protein
MNIIPLDITALESTLSFLKRGYKFIHQEWQHLDRDPIPDQGFEQRFRESCLIKLKDWNISQPREMHLGKGLDTASGICHEIDIVAEHSKLTVIVEIKNCSAEKNAVIVFFAKILDYLALNPTILLKEVCPVFMSNLQFEESALAACLGLGIHPLAPELRPLPILVDNAQRMSFEIKNGLIVNDQVLEQFQDYCANINQLSLGLKNTWLTERCGYQSKDRIVLKAVGGLPTLALSRQLRQVNADCTQLLNEFKSVKSKSRT